MFRVTKNLIVSAVLSGLVVSAQEAVSPRVPVTKDEVYRTIVDDIRSHGISVPNLPRIEDIDLPLAVPIAGGTRLRIVESCWDLSLARQQFRVACEPSGDCIPFLVYTKVRTTTGSCQTTARPKGATLSSKPLVRAGDRATVLYHRDRMRLTTFVTCLDQGAEGDVIRVRNQDGQIFRARISSATLLEALPR